MLLKRSTYLLVILSCLVIILSSCTRQNNSSNRAEAEELVTDEHSETLYAINASQYGMQYPETFILMQNRMGIRIEYCVDRGNLQLWTSPQAGKSFSHIDRNWSNRDDHTHVFDRILVPGLNLQNFIKCDWDPFHSILYFKDQTLHIAQVYDQPMVLVWFEKPADVDFKTYGLPVLRDGSNMIINYMDRGREFQSAAILSPGEGSFRHQLVIEPNRSTHARANLAPGQFLVIASELRRENISIAAHNISQQDIRAILDRNEKLIAQDLENGRFTLKDRPEMQKLLNKSRRVALSMQDFKGFLRSTNQYIYYLLWYRDGGMNAAHISYSGWENPAKDQARMELLNPNISVEEPKGVYYGQTMSGGITKWEEDGLFYVIWPAFSYWTQTGDNTFCQGKYMQTMRDAMNWLEEYCYDEEKGLFGRYYYCENPMSYSRGSGWDNASGAPADSFPSLYKDKLIVRSYDIYINMINYSNYLMLSAMNTGKEAETWYNKAMVLEKNMRSFFDLQDKLPSYGDLLTENGETISAEPYGMDMWDYVWGLSLPPFKPNLPETWKTLNEQVLADMTGTSEGFFLCCYFAMLTSMDTQIHDEAEIMAAIDQQVAESVQPGKYLAMPYSVPEMFNVNDGDPFHDVRPMVYSIAPWLSAVTNLGVRRMPFGVAVRGTQYLENITSYKYRNGTLNINYKGQGKIETVTMNGKVLQHSLQIPHDKIMDGENSIGVVMSASGKITDCLVSSTVALQSVGPKDTGIIYDIQAYGKNVLTFENLGKQLTILDQNRQPVETTIQSMQDLTIIEFAGRGQFHCILN